MNDTRGLALYVTSQALEEERNGLSHILGRERSHGTGLEQLIEASRLREASMAAEQRQLLREKQQLEAKVNPEPEAEPDPDPDPDL